MTQRSERIEAEVEAEDENEEAAVVAVEDNEDDDADSINVCDNGSKISSCTTGGSEQIN